MHIYRLLSNSRAAIGKSRHYPILDNEVAVEVGVEDGDWGEWFQFGDVEKRLPRRVVGL